MVKKLNLLPALLRFLVMQRFCLFLFLILSHLLLFAQEEIISFPIDSGQVEGTLFIPESVTQVPVVLIIAGSGPTDRNGNGPFSENNSLRYIAEALGKNSIASLRYDKRGLGKSQIPELKEADLRFEHFVQDVESWINILKADQRFSKVFVLGHSEGSLIGMIASKNANADAFISVAGPGRAADIVLKEQLSINAPMLKENAFTIIDSLKQGHLVKAVNPFLVSLFRESVQPYLISWFKYDPAEEIKKLKVPVFIIQGSTDLQVNISDSELLKASCPPAEYLLIKGMNHILKDVVTDRQKNLATYSNPDLPINVQLIESLTQFIEVN